LGGFAFEGAVVMKSKILNFRPKESRGKPMDVATGCDSPIDDQTPYSDPPLAEYIASAGYPDMTEERVKEAIKR
jgi:hypothetical protein